MVNPGDTRPPYRQVVDVLRADIESGALRAGAPIPSNVTIMRGLDRVGNHAKGFVQQGREVDLDRRRGDRITYVHIDTKRLPGPIHVRRHHDPDASIALLLPDRR